MLTPLLVTFLASLLVLCVLVQSSSQRSRTIVVEAGDRSRREVPLSIKLPRGVRRAALRDARGRHVPCQVVDGKLWWLLDRLAAGRTAMFEAALGARPPRTAGGVAFDKSRSAIDIAIYGRPFATYHFTRELDWGREIWRPCFFPVFAPGQVQIMRPYPLVPRPPKSASSDHPHHTGIWVAHGDVNGTDNWAVGPRSGRQVHRRFEQAQGGAVLGWFREVLDWTDPRRRPVVAETRTVRLYAVDGDVRLMDLELMFRAAYGKVTFGDTKEGGLCATRMRDEMRHDRRGRLVNSEGQTGVGAWGQRAEYVCCCGRLDGQAVGYALFDHPANLRHPTTWHARTYGLVTANPFGLSYFDPSAGRKGTWALAAGRTRAFRYRICLHAGTPAAARIASRYADYASPPSVKWGR